MNPYRTNSPPPPEPEIKESRWPLRIWAFSSLLLIATGFYALVSYSHHVEKAKLDQAEIILSCPKDTNCEYVITVERGL